MRRDEARFRKQPERESLEVHPSKLAETKCCSFRNPPALHVQRSRDKRMRYLLRLEALTGAAYCPLKGRSPFAQNLTNRPAA